MTRLVCPDLETTGTDPKTCQVVQVAAIAVDTKADPGWVGESRETLCNPAMPIPAGATGVHGITDADVVDKPLFSQVVRSFTDWMGDDVIVTFNGRTYDLPIIYRFSKWRAARHIDVMRIWHADQRAGEFEPTAPWHRALAGDFSGKLRGAHLFWTGRHLSGAHNALVDSRGTLDILQAITHDGRTLEECIEITTNPLPGDVDMDGKLQWAGDEVVFSFGKHKGERVRDCAGYVSWMLNKADFPEDTCKILRDIQRGKMPKRSET